MNELEGPEGETKYVTNSVSLDGFVSLFYFRLTLLSFGTCLNRQVDHIFNLSLKVAREKITKALARAGISSQTS